MTIVEPRLKSLPALRVRPSAQGKFLFADEGKLFVRGVTYGTFRPSAEHAEFPPHATVRLDFRAMAEEGINAVRTYTVPPLWLLDEASAAGLRVLVGIPTESMVAFPGEDQETSEVERILAKVLADCVGHPAVLAFAVGNELPASIVRWYGARRVERYIERLVAAVRKADPGALVTYVNYPSTEYLELPFLDLACFNVYLENPADLGAYLARLQNIAGDRPLLMTELGLDSQRNGEQRQAASLSVQLRTTFDGGCAGAFVFAWTDEWHRSGLDVLDWSFGLTRRDRRPKPALEAVRRSFAAAPFAREADVPKISVVVCTYNGSRTLQECLDGLHRLEYPDFEVIVVDDGSTDATPAIARESGFRVVAEGHRGLSGARNLGMHAARGEIVAYIDDDAHPDPHWLAYLAAAFRTSSHVAIGGPNLPPPGDGPIAAAISNAPGNPVHILLSDSEAEHIPGCNMAFRRENLLAIGGFDERFERAGDDVDVCWRLRDRGWTLGFAPAAVVWHHRRGSVKAFWRQQFHYGRAEALLEAKFPERYNSVGHHTWSGRVYGPRAMPLLSTLPRVYQGVWGRAPFQSIYMPSQNGWSLLPLMPEWFLFLLVLALCGAMGPLWTPLYLGLPLAVLGLTASLTQAWLGGRRARFPADVDPRLRKYLLALTSALHVMQPLARLAGRLQSGLTPWRKRGRGFAWPVQRELSLWTEKGRPLEQWLGEIEGALRATGMPVTRGGNFDSWDLSTWCGPLGGARLIFGLEEHGGGRQLGRFRIWARGSRKGLFLIGASAAAAGLASTAQVWPVAILAGVAAIHLVVRTILECGSAQHVLLRALHGNPRDVPVEAPAKAPVVAPVSVEAAAGATR
jgi:GT2 family glycosyltransferase